MALSAVFCDTVVPPLRKEQLRFVVQQLRKRYLVELFPPASKSGQRTLAKVLFKVLLLDVDDGPESGRFPRRPQRLSSLRKRPPLMDLEYSTRNDAPRNLYENLSRNAFLRTRLAIDGVEFDFWIEGPRAKDRSAGGRGLHLSICYEIVRHRQITGEYFVGSRAYRNEPEQPNPHITNPSEIEAEGQLRDGRPAILLRWAGGHGPHLRYEIYRDGYLHATTTESPFLDTIVEAGVPYAYNVRACNDGGCAIGASSTARGVVAIVDADGE